MPTEPNLFKRRLQSVHIQGATAIAQATLRELARYLQAQTLLPKPQDWGKFTRFASALTTIRPTEPLARNLSVWFLGELKGYAGATRTVQAWRELVHHIECALQEYLAEADQRIVQAGERLVKRGQTIFTHCHSSLAERVLVGAHEVGKRFAVYHTETRPLFQGRTTDKRLRRAHVPATMVVDSAAPFLISNHSGDSVKVSWLLLGADSISRDGSVLNKIGSFGLALAAHDSKIPVYVAAPLLKIDWLGKSTLEPRASSELWPHAPKGTKVVNLAFDRVPADYITGLITEFGIVKPSQVPRLIKKNYPFLTH
jgi:ribose 1,5-bisphosphate isomerase